MPYLAAAKELKTKPTQHSVKELQSLGIQPDILVLRAERELGQSLRKKVAAFCNVDFEAVVQSVDVPSIYEVPVRMAEQNLDKTILKKFGMEVDSDQVILGPWKDFLNRRRQAKEVVRIGLVGKYDLQDAYKSILESLSQAATYHDHKLKTEFINSEKLTPENVAEQIDRMDGIIVCPGFGQRGIEGKILATQYCREHDVPTLGICLGMQMMVIEYARNVLGYKDANSSEMDVQTAHNVIDIMEEQKNITNLGGTMRLGAYKCRLKKGSLAYKAYHKETISERHRHRFEFNSQYREEYEANGMVCSGINPETGLVEIVEVPGKKWFLGTQFHPEYNSTVLNPNPLFMDFMKHVVKYKKA